MLTTATSLDMNSLDVVTNLIQRLQQTRDVKAVVGLFSGGNDSTAMIHLMRPLLTHIAHVNTQTGVEQTSQFVRDSADRWGIPLLEVTPPDPYEHIVTGKVLTTAGVPVFRGFPGPGQHHIFYQRLKERPMFYGPKSVRGQLITGRHQAIIYVAGRRADESKRRKSLGSREPWEQSKIYSNVWWASPMMGWTGTDVTRYLRAHNVPLNEVSQILHMSAECLCGAFAKAGELDWLGAWYPNAASRILSWQQQVAGMPGLDPQYRMWGWGQRGNCGLGCNT